MGLFIIRLFSHYKLLLKEVFKSSTNQGQDLYKQAWRLVKKKRRSFFDWLTFWSDHNNTT